MLKIIYILWLRQIKRYWRSKSRIIGSIGQPILFLVALGFGFNPIFQKAGEGNYFNVLVPGIVAQGVLFTAIFSGIDLIWDRQFGFLKETLVAPVPRLAIILGRTLGGATIATFQGLLIMLLSLTVGFRPSSLSAVLLAILVMFIIALLFTSLGTAIAAQMEDFHGFQMIMNFLVMPLYFLSGALFPLNGLPKSMQLVSSLNPMAYGVDALRVTLTNNGHFGLPMDLVVLSILAAALLVLSSRLFAKMQL